MMCELPWRLKVLGRQSMRQSFAAASAQSWRSRSAKGPPSKTVENNMAFNMTEAIDAQIQGVTASGLAERLRQSSVQIGDGRGGGSGIIWESDAAKSVIITNAHVVRGRRSFVTLRDGRNLEGRVSRLDERRDLAALAIDVGGLPAATIGDSDALRVGELVFAMGNPLGLVGALSVGIVHVNGKQWANGKQMANGNQWIGADL